MSDNKKETSFDPLKAVWFWKLVSISLTIMTVWTMLKSEQKSGQIAVKDTELRFTQQRVEDMRDEITFLRTQILKETQEKMALESALGLMPDPNDPIALETAQVAKRNVMAHAKPNDWSLMYKYLVGIGWKETRFNNSAVGAAGETSTWQIMPMHVKHIPKKLRQHPDVGAKYAIKVLYDFNIPENPSKLHRYNGTKSDITMKYQRDVNRYVNKFFSS